MMKKVVVIFLFCFSMNCHSAEKLNNDWVDTDKIIISNIEKELPFKQEDTQRIFKFLNTADDKKIKNLGFGCKRHEFFFYGGYTSIRVDVLLFNSKIAKFHLDHDIDEIGLAEILQPLWKNKVVFTKSHATYSYTDNSSILQLNSKISKELGITPKAEISKNIKRTGSGLTNGRFKLVSNRANP